jgi:hypothetical protein
MATAVLIRHTTPLSQAGAAMRIYYSDINAIQQQTMQLEHAQCRHCKQTSQLISHGFVRKKQTNAEPEAVGKRVFCSNRHNRSGCGRTMQLYVDATIRHIHYAGHQIVAFVQALTAGSTIQHAYQLATDSVSSPRHAYRWLNRLTRQLHTYRSSLHPPPSQEPPTIAVQRCLRLTLLISTFTALFNQYHQPLCATYQAQRQQSFF